MLKNEYNLIVSFKRIKKKYRQPANIEEFDLTQSPVVVSAKKIYDWYLPGRLIEDYSINFVFLKWPDTNLIIRPKNTGRHYIKKIHINSAHRYPSGSYPAKTFYIIVLGWVVMDFSTKYYIRRNISIFLQNEATLQMKVPQNSPCLSPWFEWLSSPWIIFENCSPPYNLCPIFMVIVVWMVVWGVFWVQKRYYF